MQKSGFLVGQLTRRLVQNSTFEGAIQTILDDVIGLLGAEYGNLQLPIGHELAIAVQRGFSADFLQTFWRVRMHDGSACGRALRLGVSVIIPDIEQDADFAEFRQDAKDARFRSVQSTPMFTRHGDLLGVVSTHFAKVHQPTPLEMQTLKIYATIAAEYAYMLLREANAALGAKAEQMSAELYVRTLADQSFKGDVAAVRSRTPGSMVDDSIIEKPPVGNDAAG